MSNLTDFIPPAIALKSATTAVIVSTATAPSVGQVLTASSSTAATWVTPVNGDMVLASAQSVTGLKTFNASKLAILGSSTGITAFASANSSASNYTITFPAVTGTLLYSGGPMGTPSGIVLTNASGFPTLNQDTTGTAGKATNIIGGNSTTLLGSTPYQSNTNVTSLLSPNTTATKKFLRMTGTGTNGAAPAWDTIVASDVPALNQSTSGTAAGLSATLATTSGGTGVANNAASTLTISGNYGSTFAVSGAYTYTFPSSTSSLAILGANTFTGAQTLGNNNLLTIKTASFNGQGTTSGTTGNVNVDWSSAQNILQAEPTGSINYSAGTWTAPPGVCHLQLLIASDGTSTARTFTWPASVKWLGATWAAVANKAAMINFWYDGTSYWAMGTNQV